MCIRDRTTSGYIKIILDEPEDGFGQKRYQEVLSRYMVKNARLINKALVKDENEDEPDIYFPAMPEVPMINNINIRYTAHAVSYTHLRAHETVLDLVCRLLLEKKTQYIIRPERHLKKYKYTKVLVPPLQHSPHALIAQ